MNPHTKQGLTSLKSAEGACPCCGVGVKKWIFAIFVLSFAFGIFSFALAQEKEIEVNFFYGRTCPYCTKEKKFLVELEKKYPEIKVNKLLLSGRENVELLKELYRDYKVLSIEQGYVPITFIGDRYFLGFNEKIGKNIENCILKLISQEPCEPEPPVGGPPEETLTPVELEEKIDLPIIGEIDISKYSLPILAVLLGTLDGFNICSLGALVLILGLVLALRSRKKTLIFGGLFVFVTAVVYGLLIVLWYQIFSFFAPYLRIMEILIGILGIGGGIYFLRQFIRFRKYGPMCEVDLGKGIMSKFSLKFQKLLGGSGNILLLIGVVLLFAGVITVIEFPCSAVVPVIFAGILAQSQLSTFYYLLYIALFILFYMLDEVIIFLIAFFTMTIWLASSKAITWITLTESIILFLLGIYYLFGLGVLL